MFDRNGKEIKTGDVVEISGAYFKNDNGLYYVEHSPGDPGWRGSDHSLRKISKKGKPSTAKYNISFWPLSTVVSGYFKTLEAKAWDAEHATIEIREGINRAEIAAHFRSESESLREDLERVTWNFGKDSPDADRLRTRIAFLDGVAAGIN